MRSSLKQPKGNELLDFMLLYAKLYLGSGGPTSRMEDSLVRVGNLYQKHTEVFATPTGVFVTIQDLDHETDPKTALLRISTSSTNLDQLCKLEQIYTDILEQRLSVHAGLETMKNKIISTPPYPNWQSGVAAFLAGTMISFDSYQRLPTALVSGLITAIIWFISNSVLKRYVMNPVFTDFISAFLTLTLAAVAHGLVAPLSIEAYALGGIVLLVPGLALTTAISELAEQNLVSGTAKFMQATLMLLALGLAYLLFQQLAFAMDLKSVLQPVSPRTKIAWISALAVIVNISCFSVIFKVPPKALIWSTLTGISGWLCLQLMMDTRTAAAAPFLASVIVGFVSLVFGRVFKLPSQVFSVPGIVAMLPGMLALNSFRYFASGDQETGLEFIFKVAITAVSIVFGLMSARLPFVVRAKIPPK